MVSQGSQWGEPHFTAEGKNAAIAAPNEEISKVGQNILKKGGNAADAMVAASFAMSVLRPQSTGIGGGGFLLFYDHKNEKVIVLDFRERSPALATADFYRQKAEKNPQVTLDGSLAVATPGLVAGLWELHQKYGSHRMPWKDLLDPAIRLAEGGFFVYPHLAWAIGERLEILKKDPTAAALFLPEGKPLLVGATLVQKDLGKTLRRIAETGRSDFYAGSLARQMAAHLKKQGGILSLEDLKEYRVVEREAVHGTYKGYTLYSMPPPSSGGIHVVQILNILENFHLSKEGVQSAQAIHWTAEAFRRAYVDRAQFLGDPDFISIPVRGLISKKYASDLAGGIEKNKATLSHTLGGKRGDWNESGSTAHISIVDAAGDAVTSTQTVNYLFGSGMIVPGTGIVLNDEMDDFVLAPGIPNKYGLVGGEANAIAPHKRPLSSMSPTLVFHPKGELVAVLGAPGGPRIITAVAQTLLHLLAFRTTPFEAVAAGRVHHQWLPDEIMFEEGTLSPEVQTQLTTMGHSLKKSPFPGFMGDVQLIYRKKAGKPWVAVSDPRGEGRPAAY